MIFWPLCYQCDNVMVGMKIKLLPVFLVLVIMISCNPSPGLKTDHSGKPNIIIIMVDDLGYSDLGCYGGEIQTPNLDRLAHNGIRFTQFYNAARCCPTRASLMTGKYPHQVGMANNGQTLSPDSPTIAELLRDQGYHTGMAGKWHLSQTAPIPNKDEQLRWLAHQHDSSVFAQKSSYPYQRGFEEHWGVIWGVVNFFDPFSLVHNGEAIEKVADDFYMTDFITEKSIDMIGQFQQDDKPFFLYVAHTAPHWPLHALPEDIEKYKGKYDEGWDQLRESRYKGLIKQGIIDPETALPVENESGKKWGASDNKTWEARHMEAHAAMVDRVDQGIGTIIQKLEETGQLENTIIFFLADNGASPERYLNPGFDRPNQTRTGEPILYEGYERPGSEATWGYIGSGWAGAINTPFRYWKKESFEGGNCTPLIVHWPAGLTGKENTIQRGVGHVMDLLPTCMELAGGHYPSSFSDGNILPTEGKSLMPMLHNTLSTTHDTLFWEHAGGRAIRIGDWKISALKGSEWELFDLSKDRTESVNLAEDFPQKVLELEAVWEKEYARVHQ